MLVNYHTCLCPWNQYKGMWSMFGMVREVRSRTDYILDTDRRLFSNMSIRDPSHNLDNYLILGCLCSATLREHEIISGGAHIPPSVPQPPQKKRMDSSCTSVGEYSSPRLRRQGITRVSWQTYGGLSTQESPCAWIPRVTRASSDVSAVRLQQF